MLQECIDDYFDAVVSKDLKRMHHIEGNLRRLGMDKATLLCVVGELVKERKKSGSKSGGKNGR